MNAPKPKLAWLSMPLPSEAELTTLGERYTILPLIPPPIAEQWRSAEAAWNYAIKKCDGVPAAAVIERDRRFVAELLSLAENQPTILLVRTGRGSFEQVERIELVTRTWNPARGDPS